MSRHAFSLEERWAVYVVHDCACYLCGAPLTFKAMEVDHILPERLLDEPAELAAALQSFGLPSNFSINTFENWMPSCGPCNNAKSGAAKPAPVMLFQLQKAIAKADDARAEVEKVRSDRAIERALTTLEAAVSKDRVSDKELKPLMDLYQQRVDAQRSSNSAKQTHELRLMPLFSVLYADGAYRVVRGKLKPEKIEQGCPVPNTHRRLWSVHRLWHQTLKQYQNPDGFRTNLNSTIQELRNVTTLLQREQKKNPGFVAWYAARLQAIEDDDLFRWVARARNRVVRKGDLATKSTVRVQLIRDFGPTSAMQDFDVSPLLKTEEIAAAFAQTAPECIRGDGALTVERRWVANDLPTHELLAALAHVFGIVSEVVYDTHRRAGVEFVGVRCAGGDNDATVPNCMAAAENARTVIVKLGELGLRFQREIPIRASKKGMQQARERYGPMPSLADIPKGDLRGIARALHQAGRQALAVDGFHLGFVHLLRGGSIVNLRGFSPSDQADKHLLSHHIAKQVDLYHADAIVLTSEIWIAPADPQTPQRRASESPQRREGLQTAMLCEDGTELTVVTLFEKHDGKISLDEAVESSNHRLYFLDPVREVWARRHLQAK